MPKPRLSIRWRPLRVALAALAIAAVATVADWPWAGALECGGVALDDGCLFTITGGDTTDPDDGYAVTNANGAPLWDFVRERDLQTIGYPISQRWVNGPFTLQAFQKVILQWDPNNFRMNYYNTLDVLANRYPEVALPNVPPHLVLQADEGADFATIKRNHLLLLDQNPTIKERFLSEPDWLNLYGLPIRYEEREAGGHPRGLQMLRAQRTVFVIWNVPAPGVTVGRVNLQNVPDKVKQLSNVIIPDGAKVPVTRGEAAGLPVFTLPPAPPPTNDREALAQLYHATGGLTWRNNTNWLSEAPLDDWHGVSSDGHGGVTGLHLHDNRLRGTLPIVLGYLGNMRWLDLSSNQLHGAIPPELGGLTALQTLRLSWNRLDGEIPAELGRLSNLQELILSGNQLGGAIPSELGQLAHLKRLRIEVNRLQGAIPPELGQLSQLEHVLLQGNQLTGPIPLTLGNLSNLKWLKLNVNELSGGIPPELGRLANLELLYLSNNPLGGTIPPELGRLAKLDSLSLSNNHLVGEIPSDLGSLANLRILQFNGNALTGAIPAESGRLGNLSFLSLVDNQLSGEIPAELGRLTNLETL